MDTSKIAKIYTAVLLVVGLAMVIWGTLMPLGDGSAVAVLGAAAVAAGLVMVGLRVGRSDV